MVAASILAVAPTDAFAQAKAGEQTPVTVNVTTAGTLNTLVTSDQKFTTEVKLPNSVTKIKDSAFEKCAALTSVTFSKDVTEVGASAFSGCTSLKSFDFPKVKIVSAYVLSGCTALTKVVIPETVTDLRATSSRTALLSPRFTSLLPTFPR